MEKTILQKIIDREIDADIVFENVNIIAFNDINPVAPVHVLIVTKKPIESINSIEKEGGIGKIFIGDVTSERDCEAMIKESVKQFG